MGEVELVLAHGVAGADRVDRHPDLHPIARGERQRRPQDLDPHRPLPRYRRRRLEAAAAADCPMGEAERDPEAAADPPAEGRDCQIALLSPDRLDQRRQLGGRGPEVAVAEQEDLRGEAESAASAAAVTFAPFPWGRRRLTTWAPAASATPWVSSVEASSATQIAAPGNAPRRAATVQLGRPTHFSDSAS